MLACQYLHLCVNVYCFICLCVHIQICAHALNFECTSAYVHYACFGV